MLHANCQKKKKKKQYNTKDEKKKVFFFIFLVGYFDLFYCSILHLALNVSAGLIQAKIGGHNT